MGSITVAVQMVFLCYYIKCYSLKEFIDKTTSQDFMECLVLRGKKKGKARFLLCDDLYNQLTPSAPVLAISDLLSLRTWGGKDIINFFLGAA